MGAMISLPRSKTGIRVSDNLTLDDRRPVTVLGVLGESDGWVAVLVAPAVISPFHHRAGRIF